MRKTIKGQDYVLTQQTNLDRASGSTVKSCRGCAFENDDVKCGRAGIACINETRPSKGIIMIWKSI